jgi:hypothetical protein
MELILPVVYTPELKTYLYLGKFTVIFRYPVAKVKPMHVNTSSILLTLLIFAAAEESTIEI